jgi:hypothetical protein
MHALRLIKVEVCRDLDDASTSSKEYVLAKTPSAIDRQGSVE